MSKSMIFHFQGYTGCTLWRWLLPEFWQAKLLARDWLRQSPMNPTATVCKIQMPMSTWQIVDAAGNVKPAPRDTLP